MDWERAEPKQEQCCGVFFVVFFFPLQVWGGGLQWPAGSDRKTDQRVGRGESGGTWRGE